jgi:hypothetical protein
MYLTGQQTRELTEQSFRALIGLRIAENANIDYKRELSTDSGWKRELLKDVSGFANAEGGLLIYGVLEPKDELSIDAQIVGLADFAQRAQSVEQVIAAGIDPRITGVVVQSVALGDKGCVVVCVPPSYGKPHMVVSDGHRCFYRRHSESTMAMTTFEIRETVLASATAEHRAKEAAKMEASPSMGWPCFVLQAVPLMRPATPWDVMNAAFENVVRETPARREFRAEFDLCSGSRPTANIHGLVSSYFSSSIVWSLEIRRNGHIICKFAVERKRCDQQAAVPVVSAATYDVFDAFCCVVEEAASCAQCDVPYLFAANWFNCRNATFLRRDAFNANPTLREDALTWPDHIRSVGDPYAAISDQWQLELSNAFGSRTRLV